MPRYIIDQPVHAIAPPMREDSALISALWLVSYRLYLKTNLKTNHLSQGRGCHTHFRSRDDRLSGAAAAGLAERRAGFGEGAGFVSSFSSPRRPRVDLRAGLAAAGAGAGAAAVRRGRPRRAGAGAGASAAGEALRPPERPLDERRGAGREEDDLAAGDHGVFRTPAVGKRVASIQAAVARS